jgi:hypothetical protein
MSGLVVGSMTLRAHSASKDVNNWDGLHKGEIIVQTRSYLAVAGVTASTWRRMVPKRFQH